MDSAGSQRALAAVWIAAMVAAVIAVAFQLGPDPSDDTTAASTADQAGQAEQTATQQEDSEQQLARSIVLRPTTRLADELDPVRMTGSYPEAQPGTRLTVQWWRAGEWVDLPLPTTVLASGQFTTYVQLGEEGRQRVRVADLVGNTQSNPITLTIR